MLRPAALVDARKPPSGRVLMHAATRPGAAMAQPPHIRSVPLGEHAGTSLACRWRPMAGALRSAGSAPRHESRAGRDPPPSADADWPHRRSFASPPRPNWVCRSDAAQSLRQPRLALQAPASSMPVMEERPKELHLARGLASARSAWPTGPPPDSADRRQRIFLGRRGRGGSLSRPRFSSA